MAAKVTTNWRKAAGDLRREEILDAMADVIFEEGIQDYSVREIAAKIGMTGPTLLHHFGPKDEMMLVLSQHILKAFVLNFMGMVEPDMSFADVLRATWAYSTTEEGARRLQATFAIASRVQKDEEGAQQTAEGYLTEWRNIFRTILERDGVAHQDSEQIATLLVATYRGLLVDALSSSDKARVNEAFETFIAWYETQFLTEQRKS